MLNHRFLFGLFLLVSISLSLPNMSFSVSKDRLALLIGNSHYKHGGSLDNPVNDVRAIKKALEGLGFTVMEYENCSQKTMKRAMAKFGRKLKGRDVGLFFYAGHGVQVNGHNYLLPVDAKLDTEHDAEYDCVRADRVLAKMEGAGSRTNIVILDACRDNPFERSWQRGAGGSGLAFMNAPSGSLIAYSTAPGKTALDGRGRHSLYTSALLQHIRTPNITVIEMFQGVRLTVMEKSRGEQVPWESTSLRRNFYFRKEYNEQQARFGKGRGELDESGAEIERKGAIPKQKRIETASFPQNQSAFKKPIYDSEIVAKDGQYTAYDNGIVFDTKTGFEWKTGPNRDMDWYDTRSWVKSLGSGWRMPTMDEIKSLYVKGKGDRNMTPLFKVTALYVWSSETKSSYFAKCFNFHNGRGSWGNRGKSYYGTRSFAVRSRGDG